MASQANSTHPVADLQSLVLDRDSGFDIHQLVPIQELAHLRPVPPPKLRVDFRKPSPLEHDGKGWPDFRAIRADYQPRDFWLSWKQAGRLKRSRGFRCWHSLTPCER